MNKTATAQPDKTAGFLLFNRDILQRKCACGNHTISGGECADCAQKKMGLQRKLTIGASNDPLEQEADRIADQVMASPGYGAVSGTPVKVQCFSGSQSEQGTEVPASVERVLASPGQPLETGLREEMEGRFGYDFSQVRVHTGGAAERSAREVNAHAYTVGNNIVFGVGQYSPGLQSSTQLLAHELTHVIQQSKSSEVRDIVQRQVDTVEESDEVYDPRREILSLGAFSRRYPEILRTFNNLDEAMDELHWAVERYGPQGFDFAELQSRYARARSRWEEANTLLDQYWSIARVMVAVGRAGEVLVVVNAMRRAQAATTRVGFGITPEFSLLTRPHQHALTARSRINAALAEREETRRVHEVVAEEIEREHTATQERETVSRERTVAQTVSDLKIYVRTNYSAITEENNRLRSALEVARLLHANLGNATAQYIELFTRLESENSEFYALVLFRGATISYLANMGVEGLVTHVYREVNREADRSGAHMLLGAWNFDEATGEERDSAAWLLLLDVLVGIVPVVGQIADVRDISGYIYRMGKYPAQRDNTLTRIGLAGAILGLVPVVGDGAKSLLAAIRRVAVDLPVGRLSDYIVSVIARYLDAGTLQRIVDASDNFSRTLTMRWTMIQGNALKIWGEIVAEMGPVLTRVSDLTIAQLNLVREAARQYLPETLQRAGIWLGQLVRSFWVLAKLSLRHEAEDIIDMIRAYREQWQLTSRAVHELWSPTARFLAHLTPAERAAVRIRLLALAARESDEIMQGVRRLLDDTPESVPASPVRVVEATPSPIRPRVDEPPVAESAAARTAAAETSPTSTVPESITLEPVSLESVASRPPVAKRGHSAAMPHEQMLEIFTRATRRPGPGREVYNVYDSIEAYDDAWRAISSDLMGDLPQGFVHRGIIHLPPNASTLTVLHETLHWASHQSGTRILLGRFVEEGLVESFARRIAGPEAGHVYEANVSFVDELARVVGRDALDGALLHRQWGTLRRALDAHFGSRQRTEEFYVLLRHLNDHGEPTELLDQARRMLGRLPDDATLPDIPLPGGGAMIRADDLVSTRPLGAHKGAVGSSPVSAQSPLANAYSTPNEYIDALRAIRISRDSFGPSWDDIRFPRGPRRRWQPGDPPNMPSSTGIYPTYDTGRKRIWRNRAHYELEARREARSRGVGLRDTDSTDPIRRMSDAELLTLRNTPTERVTPPRTQFPGRRMELEHFIPQRTSRWLQRCGFSRSEADRLTGQADPNQLMDVTPLEHSFFDYEANSFGSLRADISGRRFSTSPDTDLRSVRPFMYLSEERLREIIRLAHTDSRIDLSRDPDIRIFLQREIDARGLDIMLP